MKGEGVDISSHYSKTTEELPQVIFDYVVTVCDSAKENCSYFPGGKVIYVGLYWLVFSDIFHRKGERDKFYISAQS